MRLTMQLFCRESDSLGENEYMVCGIIKSSEKLNVESVNVFSGENSLFASDNHQMEARGNVFDGIMQMPIWQRFK